MLRDPHVLIVEDEFELADLYQDWLETVCTVEVAYDGSDALDAIDPSIDIVFLDRRMPGLSGDTVLETIRRREVDCQVAMVTAVEPGFDIIEMGFDEYLVKPVSKQDLLEVIDRLMLRSTYDKQLQQYYRLTAKKAVLSAEKSRSELESSHRFARLEDQIESLKAQVDGTREELVDKGEFRQICYDLTKKPVP